MKIIIDNQSDWPDVSALSEVNNIAHVFIHKATQSDFQRTTIRCGSGDVIIVTRGSHGELIFTAVNAAELK